MPIGRLTIEVEMRAETDGDETCTLSIDLSGRREMVATLLIDDQRNLPADRVARTFKEGIDALAEQHWNLLYLDHDL